MTEQQDTLKEPEGQEDMQTGMPKKNDSEQKNGRGGKKKRQKRWIVLLILLSLILIGLAGGILHYLYKNDGKSRLARDEDALGGMLEGKTPDEISKLLGQKVAEGMVNVSISSEPIFEKNGKKGLIGIENLETNRYSFQVEIVGDGEEGTLYTSGIIDPGYYVEYVELNKTLKEGTYPATAIFTTYSLDETEEPIAQANIRINLHVIDGVYYQ